MKWVVLAIFLFIAGYTLVNVYYRKPGPGYRPYQDAQDRATTARLLNAGWKMMPVTTRRPVEKEVLAGAAASVSRAAAGLGPDLQAKFAEKPALVASVDRVTAPAEVERGRDYAAYFTASLADLTEQMGAISLYRKGRELVLIPSIEKLPGKELMSRWNDSPYWLDFPTAALPPGRYVMRIVARGPALEWSFTVQ
jgi:hypothetical protein